MPDYFPTAREAELNRALEALHFAFRTVIAHPDAILAEHGLSRVHHRVLYFVGRRPGLAVNELLAVLGVTKQALNAPLRELSERGLVSAHVDELDRRIKRLSLTARGKKLEHGISGDQRRRFARVFRRVGPVKEAAFHEVMRLLAED